MKGYLSQLCFILVFCTCLVLAQDDGPPRNYCSGTVQMTSRTGTLTDHQGGGHYRDRVDCYWIITPSQTVDQIVLQFEKLDLEFWYDFVNIYAGTTVSSNNIVVSMTGLDFPSYAREPIVVNGPSAVVAFHADDMVNESGFRVSYEGVTCLNRCSGHGLCRANTCECDPGWGSPDCSAGNCDNNCTASDGGGQCTLVGNFSKCVCNPGFYGGDCGDLYCDPLQEITQPIGEFSDHRDTDGESLLNAACTWHIDPVLSKKRERDNVSIAISFPRFDLEPDYDFVTIYDGNSTDAPIIGRYSGTYQPPTAIATSGQMFVTFATDQGISRTGFTADFETLSCPGGCGHGWCLHGGCDCDIGWNGTNCDSTYCPNDCNGHGDCVSDICECYDDYDGADCSICMAASCDDEYCFGTLVKRGTSGRFGDHTADGGYRPNSNCEWIIMPDKPYDSFVVDFTKFDLELDQAFITVTDLNRSVVLAEYTGNAAVFGGAGVPPQVFTTSEALSVRFTSSGVTGGHTGFVATYRTYDCIDSCSGHGTCLPGADGNGTCLCDEGWEGDYCQTQFCPGLASPCNGNGVCNTDHCECDSGYFGASCRIRYCEGTKVLSDPRGSLQDRSIGQQYRPNSHCRWIIEGVNSTITLWFTKFVTEDDVDLVRVYDGNNTGAPLLLTHSGSWPPETPVVSRTFTVLVTFDTDSANADGIPELSGFTAHWFSNAGCPVSCGLTGYCLDGQCVCFAPYTGDDCSEPLQASDALMLSLNHSLTDYVFQLQWKWYRFSISHVPYQAILELHTTGSVGDGSGALHIYTRHGSFPTVQINDAEDRTINSVKYIGLRLPQQGTWFVGIEGQEELTNYTLVLYYLCPEACANGGYCENYVCNCPSGWTGPTCEDVDNSDDDDSGAAIAAVLVILLLFAFFLALVVAVTAGLWYRYHRRPKEIGGAAGGGSGPSPASTPHGSHVQRPEGDDVELEGIPANAGTGYTRFD